LKRFIPAAVYATSLEKEGFTSYLLDTLTELFTRLKKEIYSDQHAGPRFIL